MKYKIAILGSTGSIGENTLKIIKKKNNLFVIDTLVAQSNYKKILKQINKFKPKNFIVTDEKVYLRIKKKFRNLKTNIYPNYNHIKKNKKIFDITISAIPGIIGLNPTILFLKLSKKILLANKESIICGWHLIEKLNKKYKTILIPIDSEHFSIMKLLENKQKDETIETVYITASGGPFLNFKKDRKKITPTDALKHPQWSMGKKISINSATMMNKLFEYIEAQKLFFEIRNKIKIIIHPQSQIHAAIKYKNGITNLLFHKPDMMIPIANAIFNTELNKIDFFKTNNSKLEFKKLEFIDINKKNFPPINFLPILNKYISLPIILNASNEILVDLFLSKKIGFNSIIKHLYLILRDKNFKKYAIKKTYSIHDIIKIDNWARSTTLSKINEKSF